MIRLGPTIWASLQTAIGNEIHCAARTGDRESTLTQWLTRSQSRKAALSAILRDNWSRIVLFSRNEGTAETGHECNKEVIMHELPETGFLRLPQVLSVIPLGKTCWWEGVKSGRFPKPVKLSARCTAWRAEDIRELIKTLSEQTQVH